MNIWDMILSGVGLFFVGLGLNLTPCVYPMMTVTVSVFSSQKTATRRESFLRAVVYVLGLSTTNTLLGVLSSLSGELLGSWLQHPMVLLTLAAFFVVLALSLLGVFTFQLPSAILSRLPGARHISFAGFYLSGLLAGFFAAPCLGPPLLALLVWAGTHASPLESAGMFFILSLGLGFPYLILGSFSDVITKIPRSGAWLLWFERLFGVALLGFAAFYGVLAIQPLAVHWVLPLMLAGGGIYLGFIESSAVYTRSFNIFRKIAGVLAVAIALMSSFHAAPKEKVLWEPYQKSKLETSRLAGRPVIIDLYADWCIPCQELEHFTYTDPRVIQALQSYDRYKVDATQGTSPEADELIEKYQIEGVPTILFMDPSGKEVPSMRSVGFINPDEFLALLKRMPSVASSAPKSQEAA